MFRLEVVVRVASVLPENSTRITGCEYTYKVVKLDLGCLCLTRSKNTEDQ